ncbi:uncharacterized protein LOC129792383 [Lutzomyia longipalpis]|uniref:uncharacterized protein LOC129792383 n=1 Tax=Lutzomyia longipalpis TaxID=7200 RepID=UPI002483D8DD|nr:uncharacterized protein LOC129792383 [Lutzomyia longipalpis]
MITGLLSLVSCALVTLTSGITVSPIVRQKHYTTTPKVPQMIAYFQPSPQIRSKNGDSVSSAAYFGQDVIKIVQPPDNVRGKEFIRGGSRSDLKNRVKLSPKYDFANPGLKSLPIQIDPRQQYYQQQKDFFARSPNMRDYQQTKPSIGFDINPVVNQLQVLRHKHRDAFAEDEGVPNIDEKKKPSQPLRKPPMGYEIFAKEKENFRKNITPQQRRRKQPQRQKVKKEEEPEEVPERFVPTRLYAQVRHSSTQKHRPRQLEEPRAREKLSMAKTHVVYSEDGYEDSKYDHGDEEKFAQHRERVKRNAEVTNGAEEVPMALALIGAGTNLTGEEVLEYLEEVIANSSKYLPDDPHDDRFSITSHLLNKTEIEKLFAQPIADTIESESRQSAHKDKYPFYFLPTSEHLPQSSALRYAETPKTLPRPGETFYDTKNGKLCEDIDQDVDPTKDMGKKRRLNNLGGKIDCIREKFFGTEPLDNPIFHEEFVDTESTTTISVSMNEGNSLKNQKVSHHQNPGINVYDDVISNIRASVVADTVSRHARNRQAYLMLPPVDSVQVLQPKKHKERIKDVPKSSDKKNSQNFAHHNGLPVFDISKYFPPLYVVQPESGNVLRIHPQQIIGKYRKKMNKSKGKRVSHKTKDYTVFPTIESVTSHTIRPQLIVHPVMSSGNHPYLALKMNKQRKFHYEGFIFH